jgi:hypothetical protein
MKQNKHQCGVAVGINNEPTFGHGKLNDYGYWQYPCETCAREWEKKNKGIYAWPRSHAYMQKTKRKIHKKMA